MESPLLKPNGAPTVRVLMMFVSGYNVIVDAGFGPSAPHQSANVKCRLLNISSR